jgi:hypothetical protein
MGILRREVDTQFRNYDLELPWANEAGNPTRPRWNKRSVRVSQKRGPALTGPEMAGDYQVRVTWKFMIGIPAQLAVR